MENTKTVRDNEDRADIAAAIIDEHSGREHEHDGTAGMETDLSDVMAYLFHLADRYGLDKDALVARSVRSYEGDMEDGPPAKARGRA